MAVTALVTYLVNRQITPTYEVTVRMLATESQVMDDATRRALSVARFRELLESPSLIATILQEFGLSRLRFGLPLTASWRTICRCGRFPTPGF